MKHQRPHVPEMARQGAPQGRPVSIALSALSLTLTGCDVTPGAVTLDLSALPDDLRERLELSLSCDLWPLSHTAD